MPVVGTAYVRVKVLSSGLSRDIADNVRKSFDGAGRDIDSSGERAGRRLGKKTAEGVEKEGASIERAGTRFGDRFAQKLDSSIIGKVKKTIGPKLESAFGDSFRKVFRKTDSDLSKGIDFAKIRKSGQDLAKELHNGFNIGLGAARLGPAMISLLTLAGPSVLAAAGALGTALAGELVSAIGAFGPGLMGAIIGTSAAAATALLNFGLLKLAFSSLGDAGKELQKEFSALGKEVGGPIGQNMLGGLQDAVATLRASVPQLNDVLASTGTAFGDVARQIANTITSADNMSRIQGILATNIGFVRNFGDGISGLATSFLILFNASKPFIDYIGQHIAVFGQWAANTLAAKEANGELADFMTRMVGKFDQLWQVVKDVGAGIMSIFRAAAPTSERLMASLSEIVARFREWTGSEAGQAKMTVFFEKSHELASKLFDILGKIATAAGNAFVNMDTGPLLHALDTIANVLGPAVASIFNQIQSGAGQNLSKAFDDLAVVFSNLADTGVIEKVAAAFSSVVAAIASFATTDLGGIIVAIIAPFLLWGGAISSVIGPLSSLVSLIAGLSAPVLAIGGAIAAAVGFFVLMYQNSQSLRDAIGDLVSTVGGKFMEIWDEVGPKLEKAWEAITKLAGVLGNLLAPAIRILTPILETLLSLFGHVFGFLVDYVTGLVTIVADLLSGDFAGAWDAAKGIVASFWQTIQDIFGGLVGWFGEKISDIWNTVYQFTEDRLNDVGNFISTKWNEIKDTLSEIWNNIFQAVSDFLEPWVGEFQQAWEKIQASAVAFWNGFIAVLQGIWNGFLDVLHFLFDPWIAFFTQLWQVVSDGVSTAWNAVFDWLSTRWNDFVTLLHGIFDPWVSLFQTIWDGIQSVFHTVVDAVYGWLTTRWNDFVTLLHSVFDPWVGIFQGIWDGISNVFHTVVDAVASWLSGKWNEIKTNTASIWNEITGLASTIWNAIIDAIHTVVDPVVGWLSEKWEDIKRDVSGAFDAIAAPVRTAWEAVKSAIVEPIEAALKKVGEVIGDIIGKVQSAVDTVKGFFQTISENANAAANAANVTAGGGSGAAALAGGGLAEGGIVNPVPGGTQFVIGEAGRRERVEPLDPNGLSTRDKAMIAHIVGTLANAVNSRSSGSGATVVQVMLDGRELAGVVQNVVSGREAALARRLSTGQRAVSA